MPRLFLSYSRSERDIVTHFDKELSQSLGRHNIFFDIRSIRIGNEWLAVAQQALDEADYLLLFVSHDSMVSDQVEFEWKHFFQEKKIIIPVMLQPTELHYQLRRVQYIDATKPELFPIAISQILEIVNGNQSNRISPDAARFQDDVIFKAIIEEESRRTYEPRQQNTNFILNEARKHRKNSAFSKAIENYTQVLLDLGEEAYRIEAVIALGEMRAALADLIQSLKEDPSAIVRRTIIQALVNFQSPIVSETLEIISIGDENLEVRVYAALVERFFQLPHTIPRWLNTLASSQNSQLRTIVNEALLFANKISEATGHVFISYSRRDAEDFTLQLVDTLRNQYKFRVWIDTNLTPGSDSWKRGIAKAIQQSSLLLLILSPEVHNSHYIGEELSYAEELGKDRLYIKYKSTHKPFGISEMQGLRDDLIFQDYPDEMLEALVLELERREIPKTE